MSVVSKIDEIKKSLSLMELDTLPAELIEDVAPKLDQVKLLLTSAQADIVSFFKEFEYDARVRLDISDKIENSKLYLGLTDSERENVINRILENKRAVLDEKSFNEYLKRQLSDMEPPELAELAYTRKDIIRYGGYILGDKANEKDKYERGKDVIEGLLRQPSEFELAIGNAINYINSNPVEKKKWIFSYHGVKGGS